MSLQPLGQRERLLLHQYTHCRFSMTPQSFYTKWEVTHAQMAQICQCSQATVDRWFAAPPHFRLAEFVYQRRLAEMDFLWEHYERIPPELRRIVCPPPSHA